MSPSFAEILQSDQFTFYVGAEKRSVTVHSAAIATTSKPMNVLINGRMSEAETRCATLPDIEVDDFHRFCEYAYRGDYTVPSWITHVSEPLPAGQDDEEWKRHAGIPDVSEPVSANIYDNGWDFPATTGKKKKGKKVSRFLESEEPPPPAPAPEPEPEPEPSCLPKFPKSELRNQLHSRKYLTLGNPSTELKGGFNPVFNSSADQNFTPVLLAHARLYAFANVRLVDSLKALALHKLQQTLLNFKLYRKRVGDVIELARYAYSNEHTPDRGSREVDSLRRLVVEYISSEVDIIGECPEFVDLLREGGEFVEDFWDLARTYLIS
ncbi:hypothetical protein BCR34DRAFT_616239 [Clohesyomyces aquaticus]|uniref:BTB domain-containing protein n=1 Tax=Clohesyomyces aquaticus TaxID=1231657 RepID=A0A1Y1ZEV8_9PLEO|nr:hypothetical protein BCR34DRAFT_616239 [Clohesyomyces aquaticus]